MNDADPSQGLPPPTLAAAWARIAAVRPADYARTRNALDGAVSGLSPYLTHGFVGLPEVLAGVARGRPMPVQHRWVAELGWRAYFRHVWHLRGEAILQPLHPGPLPDAAYAPALPDDVRQARTGVPVVDLAVRTLYREGHLHNHARLWLASYLVHLRRVHWRAGADWMLGHLLDGDLASNHLSWQWVAGTGSHQPYLFNADNVARHAPPAWHSPGSVVDLPYEVLAAIAHGRRDPPPVPPAPPVPPVPPVPAPGHAAAAAHRVEPACHALPPPALAGRIGPAVLPRPPDPAAVAGVAGRDVWLVHPWALGDPPADLPLQALRLGWWPAEHFARWPWASARWVFVGTRMAALAAGQWWATRAQLAVALAGARSVQTWADPHVAPWLPPVVRARPRAGLFEPWDAAAGRPDEAAAPTAHRSYSSWWRAHTRGRQWVSELPGMARQAGRGDGAGAANEAGHAEAGAVP